MRNMQEIENDILELQIEKAFVSVLEQDGKITQGRLGEYDEFKKEKKVRQLQRKENAEKLLKGCFKIVPKACAVVLAVILVFTTILFTNKTVVASVVSFLIKEYDISLEVTLPNEGGDMKNFHTDGYYNPSYLPSGYVPYKTEVTSQIVTMEYQNADKRYIIIEEFIKEVSMDFDAETMDVRESVSVDGFDLLFISNIAKGYSGLLGNYNGVNVVITSDLLSKDEFVSIVQSFAIKK